MRKTFTAAVALILVLAIAAPVVAAPRHRNEPPTFAQLFAKMVKRVFGIGAAAEPTVPIPNYTTTATTTDEPPTTTTDPKGKK